MRRSDQGRDRKDRSRRCRACRSGKPHGRGWRRLRCGAYCRNHHRCRLYARSTRLIRTDAGGAPFLQPPDRPPTRFALNPRGTLWTTSNFVLSDIPYKIFLQKHVARASRRGTTAPYQH
ncbi:hypothetical protein AGR9A_Cc120362 [Agrobacterium salinitolerans str. Hayward 0363]|nr:hypothetical protein AGR9A_Cc120362 [Agrobacterium salinitolerans str. Hayward 0363]